MYQKIIALILITGLLTTCSPARSQQKQTNEPAIEQKNKVIKTKAEWRQALPPDVFHIMREKGTERAFSSPYDKTKEKGIYYCRACGYPLFSSEHKFDSGTGWPSFYQPISLTQIGTETDTSFFMTRTEVHCARCGGHLGHIFDDGPKPTGLRYCINGLALKFVPSH